MKKSLFLFIVTTFRFLLLNNSLEKGNRLSRIGYFSEASKEYESSLKEIYNEKNENENIKELESRIEKYFLLNLSFCQRRLGNYQRAIHSASKVRYQVSCNLKAHFSLVELFQHSFTGSVERK